MNIFSRTNLFPWLLFISFLFILSGCRTTGEVVPSGFLDDYPSFKEGEGKKRELFFDKHPKDQFVTYKRGNKTVHVFRDPQSGVVLAGDDDSYQKYLPKVKAQNLTPKSQQDEMLWLRNNCLRSKFLK